jgi:transcriptional regulator with XRE-family HTH domain
MATTTALPGPGDRFRAERLRRRIRQIDLAKIMGYAPVTVSAVERGRIQPWPEFRRRAARVLGLPERELFPAVALPQDEPRDEGGDAA